MSFPIHTAIVLGTNHSRLDTNPKFLDTRVLCIMLILRKISNVKFKRNKNHTPMHIVGENQEDLTAELALYPTQGKYSVDSGGEVAREPDFVNTQAVHARVLAQVLAYPFMVYAMKDILDENERSCNVVIHPACNYVPLNEPLMIGVVKAMVEMAEGERSIMIGFTDVSGELFIIPHHTLKHTFTEKENLVLMRVVFHPDAETNAKMSSWTNASFGDSFKWSETDDNDSVSASGDALACGKDNDACNDCNPCSESYIDDQAISCGW